MLIEDDRELGRELVGLLEAAGYDLLWCRHAAVTHISRPGKNLIVFGMGSSGRVGMNTLIRLCQAGDAPILALLSATGQVEIERLKKAGGLIEECEVTPLNPSELLAKVEQLVREAAVRSKRAVIAGDVTISFAARGVWVGHDQVPLTAKEFEILAVLARQAGRVVDRRSIEETVWGTVSYGLSRSLDVHIATLRAKLNRPDLIQTVRNRGYRFNPFITSYPEPAGESSPVSRPARSVTALSRAWSTAEAG